MALGGAALGLLLALCVSVIIYASITLAYAGHINQKGSAEAKAIMPKTRMALLWISGILLVLAVVTAGVSIGLAVRAARVAGAIGMRGL